MDISFNELAKYAIPALFSFAKAIIEGRMSEFRASSPCF